MGGGDWGGSNISSQLACRYDFGNVFRKHNTHQRTSNPNPLLLSLHLLSSYITSCRCQRNGCRLTVTPLKMSLNVLLPLSNANVLCDSAFKDTLGMSVQPHAEAQKVCVTLPVTLLSTGLLHPLLDLLNEEIRADQKQTSLSL